MCDQNDQQNDTNYDPSYNFRGNGWVVQGRGIFCYSPFFFGEKILRFHVGIMEYAFRQLLHYPPLLNKIKSKG